MWFLKKKRFISYFVYFCKTKSYIFSLSFSFFFLSIFVTIDLCKVMGYVFYCLSEIRDFFILQRNNQIIGTVTIGKSHFIKVLVNHGNGN